MSRFLDLSPDFAISFSPCGAEEVRCVRVVKSSTRRFKVAIDMARSWHESETDFDAADADRKRLEITEKIERFTEAKKGGEQGGPQMKLWKLQYEGEVETGSVVPTVMIIRAYTSDRAREIAELRAGSNRLWSVDAMRCEELKYEGREGLISITVA